MVLFLIILIINSFYSTLEYDYYMRDRSTEEIYNMKTGIHYTIDSHSYGREIEIRFYFPKKDFSSNPNPFTIIYEEMNSGYIDKGILKIHQESIKEYYVVYARHSCHSYKYNKNSCGIIFDIIPNKYISYCVVTINLIDDTSFSGKLFYFGIIVFCIFISIITILKTKACGDCSEKPYNPDQLENESIQPQPQTNTQNQQLLI